MSEIETDGSWITGGTFGATTTVSEFGDLGNHDYNCWQSEDEDSYSFMLGVGSLQRISGGKVLMDGEFHTNNAENRGEATKKTLSFNSN